MDQILTDIRYALRQLDRAPGFALVAVLTLALGIGANSALFTVADSILRRPRPGVGESSSLVWIAATSRDRARPTGLSLQVAERLRTEIPLFERVATIRDVPLSLATDGEPVKVKGQSVSGDYFSMLRASFAVGRGFTADEDKGAGVAPIAVLNHHAWTTWFGSDPTIVGKSVIVNGLPLTVVGVTAARFNGAEHDEESRDVWVPSTMLGTLLPEWRGMAEDPASSNFRVLARLRGEGDREQALVAVRRVGEAIAAADSTQPAGWNLQLHDASAGIPAGGAQAIAPLTALAIAVTGLILLICCANVSNLMLARALARQREIATRLSIGASRARVVRQLLTESIVLAAMGGAAGLLLAAWGTELLIALTLPIPLDLSVDWRVVAVSTLVAVSAGVLFGLAPALHATRGGVAHVLREAGTGGDRQRTRLQGALVVAQVALSLLLLTMSGLFVRSLDKAQRIDLGFDASERVLALSVDLGLQRYDSLKSRAFVDQLLTRVRSLPGVESASVTTLLPLTEWSSTRVRAQRSDASVPVPAGIATYSEIRPAYFRTLGVPMVMGRDFADSDAPGAPRVAIVSETLAREYFGGTSVIGSLIGFDDEGAEMATIVGVVSDAVVGSLDAPRVGTLYLPLTQTHGTGLTVLVRTGSGNAGVLAPAAREMIRELDATLPVHRQLTMDLVRADATKEQRSGAGVLAVCGGLALLLAAVGLHGVMLFTVRQRTREIGIRMALGATKRRVVAMFVTRGLRLTAIGGTIGLLLALGATQLLRSMLFGIAPTDAVTFAAVAALFVVVAITSSWFPARRAARIDPVTAMRVE